MTVLHQVVSKQDQNKTYGRHCEVEINKIGFILIRVVDEGKDLQSRKTKKLRTNPQACYFNVLRQHLSIAQTVNTTRS